MSNTQKTIISTKLGKSKAKDDKTIFGKCAKIFVTLCNKACNLFFPSNIKCLICERDLPQKQEIEVCEECMHKLNFIAENACCARCGAPAVLGHGSFCLNCQNSAREFDIARSVFVYEGEIKHLIAGLKYNNKPYISRTLSNFLAQKFKKLNWQADLIIPVPLSEARIKWRGYNQAQLLAEGVSEKIGVPLNTETLIKVKETEVQANLTLQERQKNLQECFKVLDKYSVRGKRILLIDDVMTTGSTANACAHELKKAHADRVLVLTIAHGKTEIPTQKSIDNLEIFMNS